MTNNLRIIYNNLTDLSVSTITVSSTASSVTTAVNLRTDTKSKVWRSGTTSGTVTGALANIVMTISPAQPIGGIILPFCNLSSLSTIRVRGYTGSQPTMGGTVDSPSISTPGTTVFDTGAVLAAPYSVDTILDYDDTPLGSNTYAYGGGTYARIWIPVANQVNITSMSIEIVDTGSTNKYVEASRLIVGPYWSPVHNIPFGLSTAKKDMSTHGRTESGDLRTNRGPRFTSMNFDLKWLRFSDRVYLNTLLNSNGKSKPIFVSLFPNNSEDWNKEQSHQIYGKLSEISAIQHPIFEIYSTQIELEEV